MTELIPWLAMLPFTVIVIVLSILNEDFRNFIFIFCAALTTVLFAWGIIQVIQ